MQLRLIRGFRLSTQTLHRINILGYTRQPSCIIRVRALKALRLSGPGSVSIGFVWPIRAARFNVGSSGLHRSGFSIPAIGGDRYLWTEGIAQTYPVVYVKHSEHVFEHEPIPPETEPTLAIDIEALMHVFYVGARANWSLLASQRTLDELSRTRNSALRDDLLEYALGFVNRDLGDEDRWFAADFGRRLIDAPFVAAMPDSADRELLGNAIGYRCDAFCTRDRATIVKKRAQLRQVPLRIMTPAEWWAHIKPWAGLWG